MCKAWHCNKYLLGCGDDISEVISGIWCRTGSVFRLAAGYRQNTSESLTKTKLNKFIIKKMIEVIQGKTRSSPELHF